jgi:glucose-1-phosphate cytidylyltransferase
MKVVIFCGGMGLRLREYSENVPKPLVPIGDSPVIWHLMKYYSHYGHRDFLNIDFKYWNITFVDTGPRASVGERLRAVQEHLNGEEMFLANYVDGLTDLDLDKMVERFRQSNKIGCFVSVRPTQTFHLVEIDDHEQVTRISPAGNSNTWINGGYFIFTKRIFEFLGPGEDLVIEPFRRLITAKELTTMKHDGFWACMDTFKERQELEDLWSKGAAPWQVWLKNGKI